MTAPASKPTDATLTSSPATPIRLHLVLVGFMGAGKSTIGRALASRLGMDFMDLDDVIAEAAGKSIPEIFQDNGEVAFRARERSTLREVLAERGPLVIATGGGTFADPTMRSWIQQTGRSIYLRADPETLFARITSGEEKTQRPLLAGPAPQDTIRRLLSERVSSYEESDVTVHTDKRRIEEVVEAIVGDLRLTRQSVSERKNGRGGRSSTPSLDPLHPAKSTEQGAAGDTVEVRSASGPYRVLFRQEAGTWIADEIAAVSPGARVAIISDTHVAALHAEPLLDALRNIDKRVSLHTVAPGEDSKSLETAGRLLETLLDEELDRQDAIVALGGGVVGDLAGFVASTLLRGIAHIQVPTSTLAAVDASVGGKTAVNTRQGKNLVGTVHPPRAVLIAIEHLATQEPEQHAAGMAEALKMAATMDAALFDALVHDASNLLKFQPEPLLLAIRRTVALKAEVVSRDEKETGDRFVLNYGHTVGHAVEVGEEYNLLHGEAVALGMAAEAEWAETEGLSSRISSQIGSALRAFGLSSKWREARINVDAMGIDKKRVGPNIQLPYIPTLGSFEIQSVPLSALVEFIRCRSKT